MEEGGNEGVGRTHTHSQGTQGQGIHGQGMRGQGTHADAPLQHVERACTAQPAYPGSLHELCALNSSPSFWAAMLSAAHTVGQPADISRLSHAQLHLLTDRLVAKSSRYAKAAAQFWASFPECSPFIGDSPGKPRVWC